MPVKTTFIFGNSGVCTVYKDDDELNVRKGQRFSYEYKGTYSAHNRIFRLVDTVTGKVQFMNWGDFKRVMEVEGYGKICECRYGQGDNRGELVREERNPIRLLRY